MRNHILAFSRDRNMLHTLEFLLEAEQFTVSTVSGWAELHELLDRADFPVRLMILDANGSAGNVLARLSESPASGRILPVIVLTGSPREPGRRKAREGTGIVWMEKPVVRETLIDAITALLRDTDTAIGR